MNDWDKNKTLLHDLQTLAELQPSREATARAIDRAREAVTATTTLSGATVFGATGPALPRSIRLSLGRVGVAAAAVVAVAILTQWLTTSRTTSGIALGQMQRQVEKTKSVRYLQSRTVRIRGNKVPVETQSRKVMILGSHEMREEVRDVTADGRPPHEYVQIQNMKTGKMIALYPAQKRYDIQQTILGIDRDSGQVKKETIQPMPEIDFYKRIREVAAHDAKKLPDRTIDGKLASGFQIVRKFKTPAGTDTMTRDYWVDPGTMLPVRIETSSRSTDPMWADSDSVQSDIVFDAPLDESLFSTDPPEGYEKIAGEDTEQDATEPSTEKPSGDKAD